MKKPPLILISPGIEAKGGEFGDLSISLSAAYVNAVLYAGGVPFVMPSVVSRDSVTECVKRVDGIMLTGGDDINPALYSNRLSLSVRRTVGQTPDHGERDLCELLLIDEVFRLRKPLLAICRGHQLLNVAFGGILWADIASQVKGALNHRRDDKKDKIAHEVHLTEDALLVKITGSRKLGVNSTHHQAVARVGKIFKVTGQSADSIVESVEFREESRRALPFLLSVQFHPERLVGRHPEHGAIFKAFAHACKLNRDKKL